MLRKTIEIGTPGTRLSLAHRQLSIVRPDAAPATVPIEDIGVLVVDDGRADDSKSGRLVAPLRLPSKTPRFISLEWANARRPSAKSDF